MQYCTLLFYISYTYKKINYIASKDKSLAKGLVTELAPLHAQSTWRSRGESVRLFELRG